MHATSFIGEISLHVNSKQIKIQTNIVLSLLLCKQTLCEDLRNLDDKTIKDLRIKIDNSTGQPDIKCFIEEMDLFLEVRIIYSFIYIVIYLLYSLHSYFLHKLRGFATFSV